MALVSSIFTKPWQHSQSCPSYPESARISPYHKRSSMLSTISVAFHWQLQGDLGRPSLASSIVSSYSPFQYSSFYLAYQELRRTWRRRHTPWLETHTQSLSPYVPFLYPSRTYSARELAMDCYLRSALMWIILCHGIHFLSTRTYMAPQLTLPSATCLGVRTFLRISRCPCQDCD